MAAFLVAQARSDGPVQCGYPALFNGQVDLLLAAWNLNNDFTGAVMVGIMAAMDGEGTLALPRLGAAIRGNVLQIATGDAAAPNLAENALGAAAASDHKAFLTLCVGCRAKGLTWLLDLVIAEQHKKLKPENVASYFMMQTRKRVNGASILRLIEPAATIIANIRAINAGAIPNTLWMRYRTSNTSTPGLIIRALEIWGATVPGLLAAGTLANLNAAAAAPWNVALTHGLPDRLVVLTHATLKAFTMLPEDWYYGETVIARCSATVYNGYYEAARKIREVGGNIGAIRAATDIATLTAAVPPTLIGI